MITLREDQIEVVNKVRALMEQGCRSVLMQAATGFGKTVCAAYIIDAVQRKEKSCYFTVPRRELLRQSGKTLDEFMIPHSYVAAGKTYNPFSQTHVCSIETLRTRLDKMRPPSLALIDETHYGAETLDYIIAWLKNNGSRIIGQSATPWKLSGRGLKCYYDQMVCGPSMAWLIEQGHLSRYRPFAPSSPDLSKIKMQGGDYAPGQLADKMEKDRVLIGDAVKHYKAHADGKLNIAYCVSIKHSQIVAETFRDAGVPAAHIDGKTPDDERRRLIVAFANRELKVLTNCALLTFGFDLSSQVGRDVTVESMSDLAPTKSLSLQLQKWGRVLRRKPYPALIFDHASNMMEHGLPCDDREWTLEDRDKQTKGKSEITVPVRQCSADSNGPGCFWVHKPSPACPNCGKIYEVQYREVKHVEGELAEMDMAALKVEQAKKKKQEFFTLVAVAKKNKFSQPEIWATKKLAEKAEKEAKKREKV